MRASSFFSEITGRYESFTYDNLTTITYTDAVVDFDPSRISSKLKSDYLLFEENEQNNGACGLTGRFAHKIPTNLPVLRIKILKSTIIRRKNNE